MPWYDRALDVGELQQPEPICFFSFAIVLWELVTSNVNLGVVLALLGLVTTDPI